MELKVNNLILWEPSWKYFRMKTTGFFFCRLGELQQFPQYKPTVERWKKNQRDKSQSNPPLISSTMSSGMLPVN